MRRLGTDMLALACITGGALVSGAATLALAGDGTQPQEVECAQVQAISHAPSLVVSVGGDDLARTIVMAPEVRMHQTHCVDVGVVEWAEPHREQMEVARVRLERAMEKLESRRIELDGVNVRLQELHLPLEGLEEDIAREIEGALQVEMSRLETELQRLEEIGG